MRITRNNRLQIVNRTGSGLTARLRAALGVALLVCLAVLEYSLT